MPRCGWRLTLYPFIGLKLGNIRLGNALTFLNINYATEVKKSLRRKKFTNKELLWRGPVGCPRDPQHPRVSPLSPECELHLLTHF